MITKQKYHVGRRIPPKWIIGMYDVTTKKGYAAYIPNRSSETLLQHIQKVVLAATEIWIDELRSYRCLTVLGGASPYTHKTVNHSRYFCDPLTGGAHEPHRGVLVAFKGDDQAPPCDG
jgi:hypothetical protein